ncbi:MAG: hypothetical protein J6V78_05355 [Clostridia bacterium]|nr:hypothetical protein [Clostridia bacterium]
MDKCNCSYCPTIIVPGIGQSKVDLYSDNNERIKCAWPLDVDTKAFVKRIIPSGIKLLITKSDKSFCKSLKNAISEAVKPLRVNKEGVSTENLRVVDYDGHSLKDCKPDDRRYIYKMVPMEPLAEVIGEDHLYFFAYNSFGQPYETAKRLDEYIQNVKKETGHDKVNLIPVSLGGSIATAYFDAYGSKNDVNRVCYFVPATNGSTLIADAFSKNLDLSNPTSLLQMFLDSKTVDLIGNLLKRFHKDTAEHIVDALVDGLLETFLRNCPGMWAVVPKEKYESYRDKYLIGDEYKILREKTDRFYKAQSNLRELLTNIEKQGTRFFAVCGYDLPLLPFAGTKNLNSDTIVDFKSASLGGYAVAPNEKLPEDYKPQYDRCQNKEHNHISPEGTVDLGTAIFPDSTFCFRHQVHDDVAYNDVALLLCKEILTNESFVGVYSDPRFPQFNGTRDVFRIKYRLLPRVDELLKKDLPEDIKNSILKSVEEVNAMFNNTIIKDRTEADEITKRFDEIVKKAEEV